MPCSAAEGKRSNACVSLSCKREGVKNAWLKAECTNWLLMTTQPSMCGIWFRFNVIWHLPTIIKSLWCSPCAAVMSSWLALGVENEAGWARSQWGIWKAATFTQLPSASPASQALALPVPCLLHPLPLSAGSLLFRFPSFSRSYSLSSSFKSKPAPLKANHPLLNFSFSNSKATLSLKSTKTYYNCIMMKGLIKKLQEDFMKTHCGKNSPWENLRVLASLMFHFCFPLPVCSSFHKRASLLPYPLYTVQRTFHQSHPRVTPLVPASAEPIFWLPTGTDIVSGSQF